jgi:hypothetical protein
VPRVVPAQNNFTAGEVSPRLFGRDDISRYGAGVAELSNFTVMPHGGVDRRPGSVYVAEVKTSSKKVRLIPFEFSVEQAYILEFGDLYLRFYRDNGQILSGPPYEIATEFPEANLFSLQYAQTADLMYITSANHWPRKLTRSGHTSWTLSEVAFTDGPYLSDNATAITMTPSATTGAITITASSAYFNANMAPVGTEPGAIIGITHGGTRGVARITGFVSTTVVNATVLIAFGAATAVTTWREGAWSTHRGFPRSVSFFEQRLYFGGSAFQPQTLWGSAVADYEDMTTGVGDTDAVNYTISAQNQSTIQWLRAKDILFIGTANAEFTAGSPSEPLTPTNVRITPQTEHGSAYVMPVVAGNVVLFLSLSKRKVRELSFEFRDDAYRAPDVSLLAEHITSSGITQFAYAKEPDSVVWAVRSDGTLLGLTYDREQEIVGWGTHEIAGSFGTGSAVVESVACIPVSASNGTEGYTQTWVSVKRTINGVTKRYVEYLSQRFELETSIESANFVDSGLMYSGASTTTLSGLTHLEGETVSILGNGSVQPDQVVTGGAITLPLAVTKATVGLLYRSSLTTLPGVVGAQDGSTQGRFKSWGRFKARLYRSIGLLINGQRVDMRKASDPMGGPLQPFTGFREVQLEGYDEEAQITIEQDLPLPATILALVGTLVVEDL